MNKNEYDIRLSRGHVLIDGGEGLLLVDTGSPMSFHELGRIRLCGEEFPVPASLMGTGPDYVSDKVGERVAGLLGMDVIGRLGVRIDIPGGKLTFRPSAEGTTPVPSGTEMGYAFVDMTVAGRPARVILDTGAPVSYVSPSFTEGLEPVDRVTDFNPMVPGDTFETPVFEFPASFAGRDFPMRAGHLPGLFRGMLSMLGVDGVVGMEILGRVPVVIAGGGVRV
jgi:hypothetical protein